MASQSPTPLEDKKIKKRLLQKIQYNLPIYLQIWRGEVEKEGMDMKYH